MKKYFNIFILGVFLVIGCDDADDLANALDGLDETLDGLDETLENGMLNGSFEYSGLSVYTDGECSGDAFTSVCNYSGDFEINEFSQTQCDSVGGTMIPLIDELFEDFGSLPYAIFGSDGYVIGPDCDTLSYTLDTLDLATYAIEINASFCENLDGEDFVGISNETACDSIGGYWESDIYNGMYNLSDGSIIISQSRLAYCDDSDYTSQEECESTNNGWNEAQCIEFTLTYNSDHDGTCLEPIDDEMCYSDEDCPSNETCIDGECIYNNDSDEQIVSPDGSYQFIDIIIYPNEECSGEPITTMCFLDGYEDIPEFNEAQCDSAGGSMLPLIEGFTGDDPSPHIVFGNDGSFINPNCEVHSFSFDSTTFAIEIDESDCEDQQGDDLEDITTQEDCSSVGGYWDENLLSGMLNSNDGTITIFQADEGGCEDSDYTSQEECESTNNGWSDGECYQYTLSYDENHDGSCDEENDDDCNGEYDECGVCNGNGILDGACDCDGNVEDCAGECGGNAVIDECGVCDGNGIEDGACDCDGSLPEDGYDCDGNCLNDIDDDGICDENENDGDDNCSNYIMTYIDYASNFDDGTASLEECITATNALIDYCNEDCESADVPAEEQLCSDELLNLDSETITSLCETLLGDDDIYGCIDQTACNYNAEATINDESCEYAQEYYDCDGNCLSDDDGDGTCDENENTTWTFIANEGNYGASNGSISMIDDFGNVYETESLGDVVQSLEVYNDKLIVILNNTHLIKIYDITENGLSMPGIEISTGGSSPRDLEIINDKVYFTNWNSNDIKVFNLYNYVIEASIPIEGLPENLYYHNDYLWVTVPHSDAYFSSGNTVCKIDINSNSLMEVIDVDSGPQEITFLNDEIFVSRTFYDESWNTFHGITKIGSEISTENYGSGAPCGGAILTHNSNVYRSYNGGLVQVNEDLTLNTDDQIGSYDQNQVYHIEKINDQIWFALTNYSDYNVVKVLNSYGNEIASYNVGIIPGDFAHWSK